MVKRLLLAGLLLAASGCVVYVPGVGSVWCVVDGAAVACSLQQAEAPH